MSYQYPLPEGYPPPGATYGPNQPPPPPQGPGYQPPPGQPPAPGYYPQQGPPQQQWGPPGAYPQGPTTPPQGYPPSAGYPPNAGHPQQGPGYPTAGYPHAQMPGDPGYQQGPLPYGFNPPGAQAAPHQPPNYGGGAPPHQSNMAAAGYGNTSDPVLIAEINAAADLVSGGDDGRRGSQRDSYGSQGGNPGGVAMGGVELRRHDDSKRDSSSSLADPRPFFIASEGQEKCVLDVRKESDKPGTSVGIYKKKSKAAPNQLWYLGDDGCIRSKLADLTLTAASNKELHTAVYTGDPRQQWVFDGNKIVNKNYRSECLTVMKGPVGLRYKDDSDVHSCLYEGKSMQHWKREYLNE